MTFMSLFLLHPSQEFPFFQRTLRSSFFENIGFILFAAGPDFIPTPPIQLSDEDLAKHRVHPVISDAFEPTLMTLQSRKESGGMKYGGTKMVDEGVLGHALKLDDDEKKELKGLSLRAHGSSYPALISLDVHMVSAVDMPVTLRSRTTDEAWIRKLCSESFFDRNKVRS